MTELLGQDGCTRKMSVFVFSQKPGRLLMNVIIQQQEQGTMKDASLSVASENTLKEIQLHKG